MCGGVCVWGRGWGKCPTTHRAASCAQCSTSQALGPLLRLVAAARACSAPFGGQHSPQPHGAHSQPQALSACARGELFVSAGPGRQQKVGKEEAMGLLVAVEVRSGQSTTS